MLDPFVSGFLFGAAIEAPGGEAFKAEQLASAGVALLTGNAEPPGTAAVIAVDGRLRLAAMRARRMGSEVLGHGAMDAGAGRS